MLKEEETIKQFVLDNIYSDDYVKRLKAEYYELQLRHEKLKKDIKRTMDVEGEVDSFLAIQEGIMYSYKLVLVSRLNDLGIYFEDLNEQPLLN